MPMWMNYWTQFNVDDADEDEDDADEGDADEDEDDADEDADVDELLDSIPSRFNLAPVVSCVLLQRKA